MTRTPPGLRETDERNSALHLGGEYRYLNRYVARLGRADEDVTCGLGVRLGERFHADWGRIDPDGGGEKADVSTLHYNWRTGIGF